MASIQVQSLRGTIIDQLQNSRGTTTKVRSSRSATIVQVQSSKRTITNKFKAQEE
jgi:hypothetical protein